MTLWKIFDLRQYTTDATLLVIGVTLISIVLLCGWIYQSNCNLASEMGFKHAMNNMGLCNL